MWHLWLPRVALEGVGEPLVMAWKPKPDHLPGLPYRSGLVIGYRPSDTSVGSEPTGTDGPDALWRANAAMLGATTPHVP
jgi:hypothetical protein